MSPENSILSYQVQIHSGDLIQLGTSPPLVFDSEWMFGTRPNSAKVIGRIEEKDEQQSTTTSTMLPMITGKKIHPLSHEGSFSDSSLRKRAVNSKKASETQSLRSSASSTESQRFYNNSRSIGNNLLQRVVKLQAELVSKDEKIRQLTAHPSLLYYHPTLPPPFPNSSLLQQAPPPLQAPPLQAPPLPRNSLPKLPKSFELFAYRAFIGAITSQLRQFNDRVIRHPQRDSAELFNAMCRAVDVPLSSRIGEIEKYCEAVLIDNDFEDGDELMTRLESFIRESRREKILELTHELEVLMPLIRDAASNARENIKVCNVFTQWSRAFGDLLRKNSFSATTLFQAIEDLKTQFSEAHMSRHWLPPSITPILRLAALELEKRNGDITPTISPRPPPGILDRKKSIDMTLDTCLSQVETIIHEMDYHLVRLYNKAKDYSTFQPLDLDTVTRVSKIVDSMKSSVELLSEHSFKDEPPRPNSVLFFEITNDDIKNAGSTSSGSQSSLKKVSAAPKISDVFSEDDEILEERREVEAEIMKVIGRIEEKLGEGEEPMRNQGMISVDATVLKMLIQQSHRLLASYESSESSKTEEEVARRKRSVPPMILVENPVEEEEEEMEWDVKPIEAEKVVEEDPSEDVPSSEKEDPENSTAPEIQDSEIQDPEILDPEIQDPESSEVIQDSEEPEIPGIEDPDHSKIPNLVSMDPDDSTSSEGIQDSEEPEDKDPEEPKDPEPSEIANPDPEIPDSEPPEEMTSSDLPEVVIQVPPLNLTSSEDPSTPEVVSPRELTPKDPNFGSTSSESKDSEDVPIPSGADLPFQLVMPEQPGNPPGTEYSSPDDVKKPPETPEDILPDSEDVGINDDSESEDDKTTVLHFSAQPTPQASIEERSPEIPPEEPKVNGHLEEEEKPMSSHLKSHFNTANGKPHITYYQLPPRRRYSPPMKRRSQSEDSKRIRDTLKNRPPFVLY
uniref:FHA domain-containing protein n=1 Tax=Caenorhabditis tropicalis TaxID=1561998 RepID=A0A1I7URI2_9PELO